MMKLSQLERVAELQQALRAADRVLAAFLAVKGETVPCHARVDGNDFGRDARVDLLPVPKEQAVSAATRERSKIVQQLAALGVEVDHPKQDRGDMVTVTVDGVPREVEAGTLVGIIEPQKWVEGRGFPEA